MEDFKKNNLPEEERDTLKGLGFLVDDPDTEKREMLTFLEELNSINKVFKASVVMSLDCNLACKYCFEGQRKGKFYMSQETADLFVDYVSRHVVPYKEDIRIAFYGGEPLLSIDLIIYISGKLKDLAESRGIDYSASLTTNGTLLTAGVARRLKPFGIQRAIVTLDGLKESHDNYRPFVSGKGSFDTIYRNIKDVCEILSVSIGGNFVKENYRDFPLLLDYFLDTGLTPERVHDVSFSPVMPETPDIAPPEFNDGYGCSNEPWLIEATLFLREEILKRGYRTQKVMPIPCMMEMKDIFVLNYDGTIYKCPGLIGRQAFKAGDITTGVADYRQSHNLGNWKNEECLACSYLPLCFGGCRYMKLVRDGTMEGIDCRRAYFDAVLESLVLQDIKYSNQIQK